jgi:hypothetical protein
MERIFDFDFDTATSGLSFPVHSNFLYSYLSFCTFVVYVYAYASIQRHQSLPATLHPNHDDDYLRIRDRSGLQYPREAPELCVHLSALAFLIDQQVRSKRSHTCFSSSKCPTQDTSQQSPKHHDQCPLLNPLHRSSIPGSMAPVQFRWMSVVGVRVLS